MPSVFTQAQLQKLRAGDRVTYAGIQWRVKDYSTYTDAEDYATAEWLLKNANAAAQEYYLLREVDPDNPETKVNWYLSEEIKVSSISSDRPDDNLPATLWRSLRTQAQPYDHLFALGRDYYFESQTDGIYHSNDGEASRTTWDYWDRGHWWNLAIEAWEDGDLHCYSTKKVEPKEFSEVVKSQLPSLSQGFSDHLPTQKISARSIQIFIAWAIVAVGVLLMLFGGW